jgi:hypothetical protein
LVQVRFPLHLKGKCLKTPIERGSEVRFGRGGAKHAPYLFFWVGPYLIS